MEGDAATVVDAAMVREAFPEWGIAEGPGFWYAIRGGQVVEFGPRSLLRCYLRAPDLPHLTEKLGLQRYLDSLTPEQLDDVWDRAMLPEDPS
jgi:hypothetical protein